MALRSSSERRVHFSSKVPLWVDFSIVWKNSPKVIPNALQMPINVGNDGYVFREYIFAIAEDESSASHANLYTDQLRSCLNSSILFNILSITVAYFLFCVNDTIFLLNK